MLVEKDVAELGIVVCHAHGKYALFYHLPEVEHLLAAALDP